MLRRLPISLRFDDEDSDFYYGFIEQKKNDRELSSLILDLLHVYYENDDVKAIVDEYVLRQNPFMQIHEELQRIALEHSRQSVTTGMLGDFTNNSRRKVSVPPEPVNRTSDETEETKKTEETDNGEKTLLLSESKLQEIVEKTVADTVSKMLMSGLNTETVGKVVSENISEQIKKEEPVQIPTVLDVPEPVVEKPIRPIKPVVEPPKRAEQVSETPARRPASFSKLMGSMK